LALLLVLRWDYFTHLFPVVFVELLDMLVMLHHIGKESILKQVRFVIFPLGQSPQALSGIILFGQQLFESFHCLLIRYNLLTIELILSVFKRYDICAAQLMQAFTKFILGWLFL
jgi:hypothetical protein